MSDENPFDLPAVPSDFNMRRQLMLSILGGVGIGMTAPGALAQNCFVPTKSENSPHLLIDTHCHIFNAADVAVFKMAYGEVSPNGKVPSLLRGTLATIAKLVADEKSVGQEGKWLDRLIKKGNNISVAQRQSLACEHEGIADSVDDFPGSRSLLEGYSRYRTENLVKLFKTFPDVDLFTPAMVDMYLGSGPSRQNFVELQPLYTRLCILSNGRMHPFASFDPFRQALYDASDKNAIKGWSPLERVQKAVFSQGFIGVKLYPPMGYSPKGGNAHRVCGNKRANYQVGRLTDEEVGMRYGSRIDQALFDLYKWCSENDVPIMAHTNDSMQVNLCKGGKRYLADSSNSPKDWDWVAENYKKLRISLGHFGGSFNKEFGLTPWAVGQAEAMEKQLSATGQHGATESTLFADIANYSGILDPKNKAAIAKSFEENFTKYPVLSNQLMYGSDWYMLEDPDKFGNVKDYAALYNQVIPAAVKSKFFGLNAVEFLGLKEGRGNRTRLDAFYKEHNIPEPSWLQKLT